MSHPQRKYIFYMSSLTVWLFPSILPSSCLFLKLTHLSIKSPWSFPLVLALAPTDSLSTVYYVHFCVFLKKINILHVDVLLTSEMFSIPTNISFFIVFHWKYDFCGRDGSVNKVFALKTWVAGNDSLNFHRHKLWWNMLAASNSGLMG